MNSGLQVYNSVQYKMSHDGESNDVSFVWCAIEYTSARATYFIPFPNDHPVTSQKMSPFSQVMDQSVTPCWQIPSPVPIVTEGLCVGAERYPNQRPLPPAGTSPVLYCP